MTTNEERREVAKELRYIANHSLNGYSFQRSVEGTVFGILGDMPWRETMTRLADLIEPEPERTCRMNKKESKYVLSGWWECSECGVVYPPCNEKIALWALQYCPHCGAKVVQE